MMLGLAALAAALAAAGQAPPILDPGARAARDAQRLAAARAAFGSRADLQRDRRAAREQRQRTLADLEQSLARLRTETRALAATRDNLDRDLGVLHAVARSAAQEHAQRLRSGPLGAGGGPLVDAAEALTGAPASLDTLYGVWFALHGELAASARVERFDAPVTMHDGIRQTRPVTRYGAALLVTGDVPVDNDPVIGLRQRSAPADPTGSAPFLARQLYDSGFVGVLIAACALLGAALCVVQALRLAWLWRGHVAAVRRPPDSDRYVGVIASAALLLGLLGTVVGLIHTFRTLALFGGADTSLAAAGIAHALSTTLLGLCVAIPLALVQGALRAARLRVAGRMRHVDAAAPARRRRAVASRGDAGGRARRTLRAPLFLAAGAAVAGALFFLMQWLTLRPLVAPEASAAPPPVVRIDFDAPPPPPPPPELQAATPGQAVAGDIALSLPPVAPASAPLPSFAMPGLAVESALLGAGQGGVALAGAGARWVVGAGGEQFHGSDLIPISSARPKYPRAAARERLEGWVELMFTIRADGTVENVRVIDAEPPGVFEQAAAASMRRWLYAPLYRDGRAVLREATQLIRFRIADIDDDYLYDPD